MTGGEQRERAAEDWRYDSIQAAAPAIRGSQETRATKIMRREGVPGAALKYLPFRLKRLQKGATSCAPTELPGLKAVLAV